VIRDEVRIERVADDDDAAAAARGRRGDRRRAASGRKRSRREVDVSGVDFSAVAPSTASKLQKRLAQAALAFEAERFTEVDKLLASIDRLAPGVPEVHELWGLTCYRLGHWKRAITQLEHFAQLTDSVEQHPVRADCHRALRQWSRAEELWEELRAASPSAELVEEGRIIHAGTLADRGRLLEAIRVLERAPKPSRRPGLHHLRRWYALADLYERSGDLARSRRVFGDILDAEPGFGDVAERLANLG
jgi:tetratricopeptide (TPR) repeat protein